MATFKFICEDEAIPFKEKTSYSVEFDSNDVTEITNHFNRFLSSAGFSVNININNHLFNNINTATLPDGLIYSALGQDVISLSHLEGFNSK